jgi:hypothetical protein
MSKGARVRANRRPRQSAQQFYEIELKKKLLAKQGVPSRAIASRYERALKKKRNRKLYATRYRKSGNRVIKYMIAMTDRMLAKFKSVLR